MEDQVYFDSILTRFEKANREYYIAVPDEVAAIFVTGRKPVRMRCIINDTVKFQCAIRPIAYGGFYINVSASLRQEGQLVLGQKVSVAVIKDDSEYGRDIPEELLELLSQDEEGRRCFENILPSNQRGIIHYVASAKSVQVRVDRALKMINRLKHG